MMANFKRWLPIEVLLAFVVHFSSSIQELSLLERNDVCGVYPGIIVVYECTTSGTTTTTIYEITWADSTICTLRLLNSNNRFLSEEDECPNDPAIARAVRIDGGSYVSNISITVPNITSPASSIIIKCLSEGISEPIGTAILDIVLSDGFPFPGTVNLGAKNPEQGACVYHIDTNCSFDDYTYLPATNCSRCANNGSVFICSDVSPEESCHFSVQAVLNNLTSVESDPIYCINIVEATSVDTTVPPSSSSYAVAVVVPLVAVITTIVIIIFGILCYTLWRRKRPKQKANDSVIDLVGQQRSVCDRSAQSHSVVHSLEEPPRVHSPLPDQRDNDSSSALHAITSGGCEIDRTPPVNRSTPVDDGCGDRVDETSCGGSTEAQPDDLVGGSDQLPKNAEHTTNPIERGENISESSADDQVDHQSAHSEPVIQESSTDIKSQVSKGCVDELRQQMNKQFNQINQDYRKMEKKINDLDRDIKVKTQQLEEKVDEILTLQRIIKEKNEELEQKNEKLLQKDELLQQNRRVIQAQKDTISRLRMERDEFEAKMTSLETERDGLVNQLQNLTRQADVMQDDVKSTNKENEEEKDEAWGKYIQDVLSKRQDIILEAIAKALRVEKTPYKGTIQHNNDSAQPQAQQTVPSH